MSSKGATGYPIRNGSFTESQTQQCYLYHHLKFVGTTWAVMLLCYNITCNEWIKKDVNLTVEILPLFISLSVMVTLFVPTVFAATQVYVLSKCCTFNSSMVAVWVTLKPFCLDQGENFTRLSFHTRFYSVRYSHKQVSLMQKMQNFDEITHCLFCLGSSILFSTLAWWFIYHCTFSKNFMS